MSNILIDHIGWITDDIEKFESFWCDILGYEISKVSEINTDLCEQLFGIGSGGVIRRYSNKEIGPDIEIHKFYIGSHRVYMGFDRSGMNHICIHTGGKNSRGKFIESLPDDIEIKSYKNPGGWMNYFIRDYEGNWIELREDINNP